MPTYQFKCDKCETIDDFFLNFSESNVTIKCECGGVSHRVFTIPNVSIPKPTSDARRGRGQG